MEEQKPSASSCFDISTSSTIFMNCEDDLNPITAQLEQFISAQTHLLPSSAPKILESTNCQRVLHLKRSRRTSALRSFVPRRLVFLCIMVLIGGLLVEQTNAKLYLVKANKINGEMKKCKVHVNLPLYIVMDRVCELCHDFYSHEKPNMRMECRSNCFRSESYKKCLNLFEPSISSDFSTSELGFSINKSLMR